jgi:hypothetical protein
MPHPLQRSLLISIFTFPFGSFLSSCFTFLNLFPFRDGLPSFISFLLLNHDFLLGASHLLRHEACFDLGFHVKYLEKEGAVHPFRPGFAKLGIIHPMQS